MLYEMGGKKFYFDGKACNRIILILAVVVIVLLTITVVKARADVACRVNTGAVVAHIIHDGNRVEFNKTQRIWNVQAQSFIPEDVALRLNKITKEEWRGGVMASIENKDGSLGYLYIQRKDLACP